MAPVIEKGGLKSLIHNARQRRLDLKGKSEPQSLRGLTAPGAIH
jgi:hypothetical protein